MKPLDKKIELSAENINELLTTFWTMHKLQNRLSDMTDSKKTFALAGRIVGDVGECLAHYLFGVDLSSTQTKGHDGTYGKKKTPVEVKVRTQDTKGNINHIHISDNTFVEDFYLIVFGFDMAHRKITVEVNTFVSGNIRETMQRKKETKDQKTTYRNKNGFITLENLKKCLQNNLYSNGIPVGKNKQTKFGKWTICTQSHK